MKYARYPLLLFRFDIQYSKTWLYNSSFVVFSPTLFIYIGKFPVFLEDTNRICTPAFLQCNLRGTNILEIELSL